VNLPTDPFVEFPKIYRYSRDVVVTEKLDGTNAQVYITDAGEVHAGSRNRWITPEADNYGFAGWVERNREELLKLGPGSHFGEWWGAGIQRRYGLSEKRFSLFNVTRWGDAAVRPACCDVVPTLWIGPFDAFDVSRVMGKLASEGSVAAPGFMQPEGIVIFHVSSGALFKKTFEKDATGKERGA
jgi:hypothetical protein